MIPYATCLCFRGNRSGTWRAVEQEDGKRRSGRVSIEREQNAVLIRVTGPEEGYSEPLRGSSDGTSSSLGSTTGLGSGGPSQAVPSDGDRLPLETLDIRESRPLHTGRFLTMNHKRRRRRLTTRTLSSDAALLDDIHHGQAQIVLDRVGEWPFNAFTLDTVTGGRSVPILCVHLFHWYGLFDHFNLDVVCVWKLFTLVEEGYHSTNPYHNAIHAADVTQAMHCFLQEEKIREHLTPLEIMAALIGAVTHDLDHPGVNQPFLIATSNHLAALYENTSVLENHHWRSAVGCLLESGVAAQLGPHRMELEQNISSLILATDITRQQEFLTRFKRYLDGNLLDMERNTDRHFILQIALKCADISNPCRPWDVSKKWSHKVCEEFFRQGDYERKLNLPVTSLCDRHTTSVPKIQAGFFRFVVAPLFDEWHRFLKTSLSTEMSNNLNTNRARWDSLVQQEQAEETRTEVSDAELPEVDDVADVSAIDDMSPDNDTVPSPPLPLHSEDDLWSRRVGRRHSVPLSAPREPTTALTIIRRESLPGEPHPRRLPSDAILHIEDEEEGDTSHAGNSLSLSSVCSGGNGNERPVSAENLLPEPSIASITSSREASRLCGVLHGASVTTSGGTKYLTRQQTFPPLQPIGFPFSRLRYMSTTVEMSTHDERINEGPSSTDTSSHTSAVSSPEGTKCPGFSRGIVGKDVGTRSWSLGPYREGKREPESEMDPPRERNKLARLEGGCPGETAIDSPRRQPALQAGKENRDPSQPCIPPSALGDGSNQDSEQEWSRSSNHRKSLPQGLPHLQCRRGSAPVGLLKLEEGSVAASKGVMLPPHSPLSPALASAAATVLSAVVISNPDRACRRGSMPVEVSRQSVLRSLGSKENTLPSSCMARRSSLPYDLVRHNSSSLLECLNFSSGLERKKDCLAEVQQKLDPCETDKSLDVDGELVGLNWPAPRCSSAPSEERANRARERRPHSPPDSRSVTCGPVRGGIRQLPPLLLASSALPQPANAPPTARAKRKVLQRRSSGGPELFAMQSDGTEGGVGGGGRVGVRWGVTWQEGLESAPAEGGGLVGEEEKEIEDERLSTSMFQTPRVGDWCRRRGSLPVEALVTSSGV